MVEIGAIAVEIAYSTLGVLGVIALGFCLLFLSLAPLEMVKQRWRWRELKHYNDGYLSGSWDQINDPKLAKSIVEAIEYSRE